MTPLNSETFDWALWAYWIMATTLGWLAGSMFGGAIPVVVSGVAVSAFQWSVFYKRIHKAWRWFVLSSLGWIAGYALVIIIFSANIGLIAGALMGGILGIFQWIILRNEVEWAGWWVIFSIVGWTTGLVIMPGLLTTGSLPGALTGLALVIMFRYSSLKV